MECLILEINSSLKAETLKGHSESYFVKLHTFHLHYTVTNDFSIQNKLELSQNTPQTIENYLDDLKP